MISGWLVGIFAISIAMTLGLLYNSLRILPREMHEAYREALLSLALTVEAKQPAARGHSERVADLCVRMAQRLRLSRRDRNLLEYAALMHDVGKAGVRAEVLNKPCELDMDEQNELRLHTVHSAAILDGITTEDLREMAVLVKWHDTPWQDVQASPRIKRLVGILAVAEAWDTLTRGRSYRPCLSSSEARELIVSESGRAYSPESVEALLDLLHHHESAMSPAPAPTAAA